jgi:leucyl aminopeptidase
LPAIIHFSFENEPVKLPSCLSPLVKSLTKKEFNGASKKVCLLRTDGLIASPRLMLVGLGTRATFNPETLRCAAATAVRKLAESDIREMAAALPDVDHHALSAAAIVEAAIMAPYKFTKFKSPADAITPITKLILCLPAGADVRDIESAVKRSQIAAEAVNFAREIGNLPGNVVWPEVLGNYARQLARSHKLKCTILDKRALERGKFGGILAVGGGSARDPRLIVLEYNGTGRATRSRQPVALVGKAITFDTGGISIKPSDRMEEMKFDKCGGVAVLATMKAIAEIRLPLHVIAVIGSAENMPSATSYRPGDIVTSYPGKDKRGVTIEVLNTDAEGRIVLGDAIAYARQQNASAIIDLATLTGACVVALGSQTAGLFGNNAQLIEQIRASSQRTGDSVWPMPLFDEYKEKINSDVADHKNTGGREGGACTAAAFLSRYAGDTPWAHLDIAGTAWTTQERPLFSKGATGFGVRLLLDLLSRWG